MIAIQMELLWLGLAAVTGFSIFLGIRNLKLRKNNGGSFSDEQASAPSATIAENKVPNDETPQKSADYEAMIFGRSPVQYAVGSLRGNLHVDMGIPRQDAFAAFDFLGYRVLAVSDGVSSASLSHEGSAFLVENLEKAMAKTFASDALADKGSWEKLSRTLSQMMLAHFAKKEGVAKELTVDRFPEVMGLVVEKYAATLEVLVIGESRSQVTFRYVQIAGDGSLHLLNPRSISKLKFNSTEFDLSLKKDVSALPGHSAPPNISEGIIPPGSHLMLSTDGVGDFIESCEPWLKLLHQFIQQNQLQHGQLLEFIQFPCADSFDDRTVAIVKTVEVVE